MGKLVGLRNFAGHQKGQNRNCAEAWPCVQRPAYAEAAPVLPHQISQKAFGDLLVGQGLEAKHRLHALRKRTQHVAGGVQDIAHGAGLSSKRKRGQVLAVDHHVPELRGPCRQAHHGAGDCLRIRDTWAARFLSREKRRTFSGLEWKLPTKRDLKS